MLVVAVNPSEILSEQVTARNCPATVEAGVEPFGKNGAMMISVRRAVLGEVKEVLAHLMTLHFEGRIFFTEDSVLECIEQGHMYVAIDMHQSSGGSVLGAMIFAEEHGSYRIRSIACKPDSQHRGAGTALVEYAIQRCREEGVPKLWCWSMVRYGVIDFYKKLDFMEAYKLEKHFFGQDCWLLGKVI